MYYMLGGYASSALQTAEIHGPFNIIRPSRRSQVGEFEVAAAAKNIDESSPYRLTPVWTPPIAPLVEWMPLSKSSALLNGNVKANAENVCFAGVERRLAGASTGSSGSLCDDHIALSQSWSAAIIPKCSAFFR
jgi:hypothetical protein